MDRIPGLTNNGCNSLLYLIAKECPGVGDILEVGSFRGRSSFALALGNSLSKTRSIIWLVEPNPMPNKDIFLANFKTYPNLFQDIKLLEMNSETAVKVIDKKMGFRFIFIDGEHYYEYVKKDILLWQDFLQEGGIIALHDYNLESVFRAFKEFIIDKGGYELLGGFGNVVFASKRELQNKYLVKCINRLVKIRQAIIDSLNITGVSKILFGRKIKI